MANGEAGKQEDSEFYGPYAEYSKTLRAWFVSYGIGGPVVLLSSDKAWDSLVESGCGRYVGLLFISGGIIQILSALLNKHSMWLLYLEEVDEKERKKRILRLFLLHSVSPPTDWLNGIQSKPGLMSC